ncbi:hypothetical protein BDD12DRAFT_845749 [Trichophaea hybrida]|nr:hypothetical protein BDD12DRAFT_845749 [Trichophaea hybrida]
MLFQLLAIVLLLMVAYFEWIDTKYQLNLHYQQTSLNNIFSFLLAPENETGTDNVSYQDFISRRIRNKDSCDERKPC